MRHALARRLHTYALVVGGWVTYEAGTLAEAWVRHLI